MPTVTVPRAGLATEEVVTALRDGLGDRYHVLPGMAIGQLALVQGVREGGPDTIVVGTHGNRIFKAQVTIVRRSAQTELQIVPGGITFFLVVNTLGIARKVQRVLASSPSLSAR